jgi:hypothetical protein
LNSHGSLFFKKIDFLIGLRRPVERGWLGKLGREIFGTSPTPERDLSYRKRWHCLQWRIGLVFCGGIWDFKEKGKEGVIVRRLRRLTQIWMEGIAVLC